MRINRYTTALLATFIAIVFGMGIIFMASKEGIAQHLASRAFSVARDHFSGDVYRPDIAMRWLRVAEVFDSQYPELHYQLARAYFVRGDLDRALEEVNSEIANRPEYARSFYLRGLVFLYKKDFTAAIENFSAFNAVRPDNWAGFNDLAYAYLQIGDYTHAEWFARKGLENRPGNAWLNMNLGVALLNLERRDDAREVLRIAVASADRLTEADAIAAYPSNNPEIALKVLDEIRDASRVNLSLVDVESDRGVDSYQAEYVLVAELPTGRGFAIAACDESIGLDVIPSLILRGQSSTLKWSLMNVGNCVIDNGIGSVTNIPNSTMVSPSNSTSYTLNCSSIGAGHSHGTIFTETALLRVRWADMTASANGGAYGDGPYTLYMPNTSTRLAWQSEEASSCSATGDLSGPITVDGSRDLGHLTRGSGTPGLGRLYRFGVNCEGASDSVDVRVMQLPTCTISPNKTTVTPPETVRLNWSCRYADSGTIADNHGGTPVALSINNNADYQSSGIVQVRISDNQTYIYTLRAIGIDGTTSVASAVINGPSDGVRIREDLP